MSTKRFRVWLEDEKKMISWDQAWHMQVRVPPGMVPKQNEEIWLSLLSVAFMAPPTKMVAEQWTGLTDSNEKDVFEGDVVELSEARYESELLNPDEVTAGAVPIYFADVDKPLPAPDVPYARGVVEWDVTMCGWCVRYTWLCESWKKGGAASVSLGGKSYTLHVLGNIHQNPELLS